MSFCNIPTRALVLAAVVLAAAGCTRQNQPAAGANSGAPGASAAQPGGANKNANTPPAPEAIPVEVAHATTGPIAAFLSYNSTLEVENAIDVFPEAGGLVEKLLVEEGDRVKAGDPLLQLEHKDQLVELKESQVNLAHLEASFRRTEELYTSGLINQQDFETRKYELEQARLRLERAELRVYQATVRAPVDGVVTERVVQPGARVGSGTKLFGLMSLDDLIARVHVPGRYLTAVIEGQEAKLSSEFLPGRTFEGWVKRISPIVDAASGTFKVTIGVRAGAGDTPPPGLFVNVRVVTDRRQNAVLVPKRAIVYEGGERYVFLVRDGKAAKTRLNVGYEEGEFVEALADVSPGTPIVVLGQNALKDQAVVRIVTAAGPTAAATNAPESPAKTPADS